MRKIPKFKSDEEATRFWQSHTFKDYNMDTAESEIRFVRKPRRTIAIRLDSEDVKAIEKIAHRKGLGYTSLLRMWIKEYLAKEGKDVA